MVALDTLLAMVTFGIVFAIVTFSRHWIAFVRVTVTIAADTITQVRTGLVAVIALGAFLARSSFEIGRTLAQFHAFGFFGGRNS